MNTIKTIEELLPWLMTTCNDYRKVSNISSNEIQAAKYEGMKDATERIIRKIDLLVKLKILK